MQYKWTASKYLNGSQLADRKERHALAKKRQVKSPTIPVVSQSHWRIQVPTIKGSWFDLTSWDHKATLV